MTFSLVSLGHAAITISGQTGKITITMPNNVVITVNSGEVIPPIPDGATVEFISGSATISVTGSSTVTVKIGKAFARLDSGDTLQIDLDARKVTLIDGAIDFVNKDGTITTLDKENSSAEITPGAEKEIIPITMTEEPPAPEREEGSQFAPE
jgi:hypothetical protein